MTNKPRHQLLPACAGLVVLALSFVFSGGGLCLGAAPAAATPKAVAAKESAKAPPTITPPVEVEIPQSLFVDDIKKGRDPFFPNSTRRLPRNTTLPPPRPSTNSTGVVVVPVEPLDLKLKGLAGTVEKRLAIINDTTIAVGEEVQIKAGNRRVKVHCWEVRPNSVIITVDGSPERKELFLRGE